VNLGAFEESLARCEAKAYRLAVQLVCSEPAAREIVEKTFLSAWQNLDKLASRAEVETWVYQATVKAALECGACSEAGRRASRDNRLVLAMNARKLSLRATGDTEPDPLRCSRRSVASGRRIQGIVNSLPQGLRAVLVLCDMEEMSPEQLARLLGLRSEEVRRRLLAARLAVRNGIKRSPGSTAATSSRMSSKRPG